jgi:hypothetical protein
MSRFAPSSRSAASLLALSVTLAACFALVPQHTAPRPAPTGPSYLFLSPNTDGDLSLAEVSRRLVSPAQKQYRHLTSDLLRQLGLAGAEVHDAVGDWSEGVENSLLVVLPSADPQALRCAAAWFGLMARQKAVLAFHADPWGSDFLVVLDLPERDFALVRCLLDGHGIRARTILTHACGSRIVVLDRGGQQTEALRGVARHSRARLSWHTGRAESLDGPTPLQARQRYREVIRAYQISRSSSPLARLGRSR